MNYIKIGETLYPCARIAGNNPDVSWNRRDSKSVTLEMAYDAATKLFIDGLAWSIVTEQVVSKIKVGKDGEPILNDYLQPVYEDVLTVEEFDNSDYCVAGAITDNRNGTITVKMGKRTEVEILRTQMENAITEDELNAAYAEGVNSL